MMNIYEGLTIFGLFLNAVAVGIVAYQSKLNRDALISARKSVEMATRTKHIEMLPNAGFAIHINNKLARWIDDLSNTAEAAKTLRSQPNENQMNEFIKQGLKSPASLVTRYIHSNAPSWLSAIYISSAQFYFNAKVLQASLSTTEGPKYTYLPSVIERCEESAGRIRQLLAYLDDIVPEAYLETPASIDDARFLSSY